VQRDRVLFGSAQTTQERYQRRYIPGQRRYLATAQPQRATDGVIDNHDPATPRLIVSQLDQPAEP
jgi:uridine kinase